MPTTVLGVTRKNNLCLKEGTIFNENMDRLMPTTILKDNSEEQPRCKRRENIDCVTFRRKPFRGIPFRGVTFRGMTFGGMNHFAECTVSPKTIWRNVPFRGKSLIREKILTDRDTTS